MPALARNPSSLTKERLTEELRKNNVPLPSGRAKKEVYVELYRRHVLGERSVVGEEVVSYRNMSVNTTPKLGFSSDEEDEVVTQVKTPAALNVNNNRNQRKASRKAQLNEFEDRLAEVEGLSDADLRKELQARGVAAGPIVASTRAVYERKLADILLEPEPQQEQEEEEEEEEEEADEVDAGEEESAEDGGDSQENDHYSDSDVDDKIDTPPVTRSVTSKSSYKSRVTQIIDQESSKARQRSVTPQRKTETTSSTTTTTTTVTKGTAGAEGKGKWKPRVPVWLQILIFLLVAAFLLLIWYTMESGQSESPLVT